MIQPLPKSEILNGTGTSSSWFQFLPNAIEEEEVAGLNMGPAPFARKC
jgi:hypothetical protein